MLTTAPLITAFLFESMALHSEPSRSMVLSDVLCPVCRAETGYHRCRDQCGALCFVDVLKPVAWVPDGLNQRRPMERFHVCARNGAFLAGA
jgi:hypothetical protein